MRDALPSSRVAARLAGGALALCFAPFGAAVAFPILDPSNQSTLATGAPLGAPLGVDLPAQDAKGLQTQGKLIGRPTTGTGIGWSIVPRLTIQEMFTDNAYEVKSPRRFDASTVFSPGIAINADTPRIQMRFDYQPNLVVHAINGPLNALTQQLNLTGLITVIPDLAYVDVRGLSGVQSRLGGQAGSGSIGSSGSGVVSTGNLSSAGAYGGSTGTQGLNRQNQVQTSSFGISPYLLRQFGDYGTGKLGASVNASRYSTLSGFASAPIPIGGTNGQSLLTTEQIAQFTTGNFLGKIQDTLSVNLSQSTSRSDAIAAGATVTTFNAGSTFGTTTTASTPIPSTTTTSRREIVNNQVSYALNRNFTLLGAIGHEHIQYSQAGFRTINGITWSAGITVTPDPDSSLTLTYGHQNGANAFGAHGRYAFSARTALSFDYSETVGTQLENLQRQLNGTVIAANGQAINAQTGGPQFLATNGLGVQSGLFRFRTFNASLQSVFPRDTLTATLTWSEQGSLGGGGTGSTEFKTISLAWVHELTPDMSFSSGLSYSFIRRPGGTSNDGSFSGAVALQYAVSPSTTLSARYSFFDRISGIPGYSMYENILLVGITKQF